MSDEDIVRYGLDRPDPVRLTAEEQARLDAMSEEEIVANALTDPDNPPLDDDPFAEVEVGKVIRLMRRNLGLDQEAFSARFRVPLATLRDWEEGRREPEACAKLLLRVIGYAPETVAAALWTPQAAARHAARVEGRRL